MNKIRLIIMIFIFVIISTITYTYQSGKKQDEKFLQDQNIFNQTASLMQEGQYDHSLTLLSTLEEEYKRSFYLNYYLGVAYANKAEWRNSVTKFQRAIDLNPYFVEDITFMFQYARVLINADMKEEAREALEYCSNLPGFNENESIKKELDELLLLAE